MPRGGFRPGAGRKSKKSKERELEGSRDRTRARDAGAGGNTMSEVAKPGDLDPITSEVWDLLAPGALAAGTLTEATSYAFQTGVCELIAERRRYKAQVELDGIMIQPVQIDDETGARFAVGSPTKHPLIPEIRQLQVRIEANMQRFMITALGKSMAPTSEEPDAFAEFGGLSVVQGGKR